MSKMKNKYFDDGKSGYCCWDMLFAIEEGYIEEDEDLKGYFCMPEKDGNGIMGSIGGHPLFCCPFCGGDFKHNGRMGKLDHLRGFFRRIK